MIHIDNKKNIGLIFLPRSGSHVLQHYLKTTMKLASYGEIFNTLLNTSIEHGLDEYGNQTTFTKSKGWGNIQEYPNLANLLNDRNAEIIKLNQQHVVKILIESYMDEYPEFSVTLSQKPDTQYINILRADVLYSFISVTVCKADNTWHLLNSASREHTVTKKISIPIDRLEQWLITYIRRTDHIHEHFGDIPVIYYEQFQFNPGNLRNMFSGIPKQIVSMPYSKFVGNHKDWIENLNEVEDFYEQFVNKHQEYFPQYFNKLPGVTISACQGRQPKDLLLTQHV